MISKYLYALIISLVLALSGCGEKSTGPVNSEAPPAFTLDLLSGGKADFPNNYKDKVVAIRFWADWCQFCETEMNTIEPVYQKYKDDGLVILAINVAQEKDQVEKFIKEKLDISYDVVLDTESLATGSYGVTALPVTYFAGRDGLLHTKIIGESTPEVFESLVKELL